MRRDSRAGDRTLLQVTTERGHPCPPACLGKLRHKSQIHKDQFRQQSGALDGFNMTLVFTFLPKRYLRVRNFDSRGKRVAELASQAGGQGCPRSDFGDYAAAPSLAYHMPSQTSGDTNEPQAQFSGWTQIQKFVS